MPFELFLALRYLRSRRRRVLARITGVVAVLAIAVGVGALITALALANGFHDEMQDKILRGTAHLTVLRRDNGPIENWTIIKEQIKKIPGVSDASASTYTGALVTNKKGASEYAVLRGLDAQSPAAVEGLRRLLIEGSSEELDPSYTAPDPGCTRDDPACGPVFVLVGVELAQRLNLHLGDEIELTSGATQTAEGATVRPAGARIVGILRTGLYEYDATWIFLSLRAAGTVNHATQIEPSVISVQLADLYATPPVAAAIRAQLGTEYTTVDWQQANGPLFAALALERRAGAVIIGLIILIAVLNITSTLILVVVERRVDIAILGALGARARSIMLIFMVEGAFIGLAGAIVGVALGLLGCYLGQRFHLVSLPPDVYSISSVPFHPHPIDVFVAAMVAFGLSLLSTIYPARAASRVRPVEILRDSG